MYLSEEWNQLADFLSCHKPHWESGAHNLGPPWPNRRDVFALEMSTYCPLWFSLTEMASILGQDALAHPRPEGLYAFPLFPLI